MAEKVNRTPIQLDQSSRLAFLFKDSILYGGAAAVSKSFALITFPLLARHFSLADYGVLDFFMVFASFLAILFVFGQDSAVARYFYEHEDNAVRCQLISQSLVFQLAGLFFLLPLLWWAAGFLPRLLVEAPGAENLFKVVLLQLPFLVLINFSQNLLKWSFARAKFLAMSLGLAIAQSSFLVIGVLVFDIGIQGVFIIILCTSAVFGCLGLFFVRAWLTRISNLNQLRVMLPYAIPLGVICVLGAFSPTLERSLAGHYLGNEALGLYAAGTKIAMLVGLVVSAFQTAWGPFSLSLYKETDSVQTYSWVLKVFSLGICLLILILTMLAKPIICLLASDSYAGAAVVVFPLAMGLAVQATGWITEIGIGLSKRSYLHLYSYTVFMFVALVGIQLLAPVLGLVGVALGVLVGQITKALISSWLAQRVYPMSWPYVPVITILALTLLVGVAAIWVGHVWGNSAHSLILVFGVLMVLTIGWGLLFTARDRKRIWEVVVGHTRPFKRV